MDKNLSSMDQETAQQLKTKLQISCQKLTALTRQKENLSATCQDQAVWIAELTAKIEALRKQFTAQTEQLETARIDRREQNQRWLRLREELKQQKELTQSLRQQVTALEDVQYEYQALKEENDQIRNQLESLQMQFCLQAEELETLKSGRR